MSHQGNDARSQRRLLARGREARRRLLAPRLVLLLLAGCLLFGYPILGLFSGSTRLAGVPILFVYVFSAWGAFIAVLARLVDSGERRRSAPPASATIPPGTPAP